MLRRHRSGGDPYLLLAAPGAVTYPRRMELAGKVAVVTGAASGIGSAMARALGQSGASVLVADVDAGGGTETVEAVEAAGGIASFTRTDVRELAEITAMLDTAVERFGGLDVLCNNAGIVCGEPLWPATSPERLADQVAVNLGAVILGTRLALERFGPEGGVVVNTASIGALLPLEDEPGYSATKAGVAMFTRACTGLAATRRVRVNAILPGLVETPLLAKSGDGSNEAGWATMARGFMPMLTPEYVAAQVLDIVNDDTAAGQCRIVGELPDFVTEMVETPFTS
jgi:NAD(P)-dependent dehydrogenase (short-subunit alcohol dehydrogenase family)